MHPPMEQVTAEGYDLQFGTNVVGRLFHPLAHTRPHRGAQDVALTTMRASSPLRQLARMAGSCTGMHSRKGENEGSSPRWTCTPRASFRTPTRVSVHFGNIETDLYRHTPSFAQKFLHFLFRVLSCYTPSRTERYSAVGLMLEAVDQNGELFIPWGRPGNCPAEAYKPGVGQCLWDWLEEEVKGL
ncbi:hypothetical protein LXA43DRAFT_283562 [Ganoderma leucocontextum]|nr:hypothetical protein LXA43DRAFT_283562 [Ganoderma leucocontextum]